MDLHAVLDNNFAGATWIFTRSDREDGLIDELFNMHGKGVTSPHGMKNIILHQYGLSIFWSQNPDRVQVQATQNN
jgi:hypothetical protein